MSQENAQQWIVVRNWTKHQHYHNRWVPWIKFYTELLHDPAYTRLPEGTRLLLCHIWLEYASSRAQVPLDTRWLSSQLSQRVTKRQLEALNHAGFIEFSSSPNLDHVYMSSRPTRAREEGEKRRTLQGSSSLQGLSTTTRDADAPRSLTERAPAPQPDEETEHVKNGKHERPAYDIVQALIRNGGYAYTDAALLDEMDIQARNRETPLSETQRTELLKLAATLRTKTADDDAADRTPTANT